MNPRALPALHRRLLSVVVRGGAVSRADLSRRVGLSRSKLSPEIARLLDSGLLVVNGFADSSGGRRGALLSAGGADVAVLAGVDVDTEGIAVAVTTLGGEVVAQRHVEMDVAGHPATALNAAAELIDELTGGDLGPLVAIGVSIAADIDPETAAPMAAPTMPRWDGWPIGAVLARRFGVRVFVDNDVNALAIGESAARAAGGQSPLGTAFLVVKISSGLGCGVVVDGTVFRGARGLAGDIGHICVDPTAEALCACGNTGCLEVLASAPAIVRQAEQLARDGASPELARALDEQGSLRLDDVGAATVAGDAAAVGLLRDAGSRIGFVLAGVVTFFNPSAVVVSSGIAAGGELLLSAIRQAIYQRALPGATRDLHVVQAPPTRVGGSLGAAVLAGEGLLGTAGRVAEARPG